MELRNRNRLVCPQNTEGSNVCSECFAVLYIAALDCEWPHDSGTHDKRNVHKERVNLAKSLKDIG